MTLSIKKHSSFIAITFTTTYLQTNNFNINSQQNLGHGMHQFIIQAQGLEQGSNCQVDDPQNVDPDPDPN